MIFIVSNSESSKNEIEAKKKNRNYYEFNM